MKRNLVILGVFQLFLQFFLLDDKLLVLVFQGLVLVLIAAQLLKKCSDLLVSLLEPGLVTDLRQLIVNLDDCFEAVLEVLKDRLVWLTLDDAVAAGQQRVDDFIFERVIDVVFVLEIHDFILFRFQLCVKLCDQSCFDFDQLGNALSDL